MEYEPTDQPSSANQPSIGQPPAPSAGPATSPPPPVARQLVRDPYTRLGGVASGLSHHYGIDVSLVRLAFVLFTITSGFGLLIYVLAWLIIPRAEYWPPVGGPQHLRSLSTREIGIGLLVVGALVGLFFGGGTFSQVVVPILLVVGGVWLLLQPDAERSAGAASFSSEAPPPPLVDPVPPQAGTMPAGSPVAPTKRRWRGLVIGLLVTFIALPVLAIIGIIGFLVFSDFQFDGDFEAEYRPATIEELPRSIDHGQGSVTVDLTELDPATFDGEGVPLAVDLEMGEVIVLLPEDVDVDVEASAGLGQVNLFGDSDDGISPRLDSSTGSPDLELDVRVGLGEVTVERR